MICTMISLIDRVEARERTIPQFQAVGIEPVVFLSDPKAEGFGEYGNARGNAAVSKRALTAAKAAKTDLLFVEDDIDLSPLFPDALELARWTGEVAYLYAHDDAGRLVAMYGNELAANIKHGERLGLQAHPIPRVRDLNNSQCVYIPKRRLDLLGRWPPSRSFDIHLWMTMLPNRVTPFMVLPHPVQHRVDTTQRSPKRQTRDSRQRRSRTFDLGVALAHATQARTHPHAA